MKNKKKNKKVLNVLFDILIWTVILIAAFITISSLSAKDGVASFLGKVPLSIQTNSMEPKIKTGDLIITTKYDGELLKKDDVISFKAIEQDQKIIKTHRVIEVIDNYGIISYVTQGDNNTARDEMPVTPFDIISVYKGTRIGSLGKAMDFLKSQWGFFIFIVLPLFVFFIYQLYTFMSLIIESKKEEIIKAAKES